jgi:hypothetical protein
MLCGHECMLASAKPVDVHGWVTDMIGPQAANRSTEPLDQPYKVCTGTTMGLYVDHMLDCRGSVGSGEASRVRGQVIQKKTGPAA